jgi:hypothetical protein
MQQSMHKMWIMPFRFKLDHLVGTSAVSSYHGDRFVSVPPAIRAKNRNRPDGSGRFRQSQIRLKHLPLHEFQQATPNHSPQGRTQPSNGN